MIRESTVDWTRGYLSRYNDECSGRIATANLDDVKRIIKAGGNTVKKLTERLEKWPLQRAKYMADSERAFITNEAKIAEFRRCGYDSVWIAGAGCCKACTELNGITIKGSFRPPLHGGCNCSVGIGKRLYDKTLCGKDGAKYSVSLHALERMEQRGILRVDVEIALTNPLMITKIKYDEEERPSCDYIGEFVTATVNPNEQRVVTAHKTHSKLARRLKDG